MSTVLDTLMFRRKQEFNVNWSLSDQEVTDHLRSICPSHRLHLILPREKMYLAGQLRCTTARREQTPPIIQAARLISIGIKQGSLEWFGTNNQRIADMTGSSMRMSVSKLFNFDKYPPAMVVLPLHGASSCSTVNGGDVHIKKRRARRRIVRSSFAWRCAANGWTKETHQLKPFRAVLTALPLELGVSVQYGVTKCYLERMVIRKGLTSQKSVHSSNH